jgi:hypothetical protein
MSHPPPGVRRWFVSRYKHRNGLLALLLSFPLAYGLKLLLLLCRAWTAYVVSPTSSGILRALGTGAGVYVQNLLPVIIAMIVGVLLWPKLGPVWARFVTRSTRRWRPLDAQLAFWCAALIILGYLVLYALLG